MNNNHAKLVELLSSKERIKGQTHNFYRYPARFSPRFAKLAIEMYSSPGDLVLDPFVGGGTTLIESMLLGRRSIGIDLNPLAIFVSRVKTTLLTNREIDAIIRWSYKIDSIKMTSIEGITDVVDKNMNTQATWRLRNLIANLLISINHQESLNVDQFIRCCILRTSQWALDTKFILPNKVEFIGKLRKNCEEMLEEYKGFEVDLFNNQVKSDVVKPILIHGNSIGIAELKQFNNEKPKLIVMSPPYPGVHVIYHHWQIQSRRETSAPYWIIGAKDGQSASYYSMGSRFNQNNDDYFNNMQRFYNSLYEITDKSTTIVQLIAFSSIEKQLPKYLNTIEKAGFVASSDTPNELITMSSRQVPNRRWYTQLGHTSSTSGTELVLIHTRKS